VPHDKEQCVASNNAHWKRCDSKQPCQVELMLEIFVLPNLVFLNT
jgi:hypothetical protein